MNFSVFFNVISTELDYVSWSWYGYMSSAYFINWNFLSDRNRKWRASFWNCFTTFFSTVSVCDLFGVVLQIFIFFRHVRTSHARSVRYDDDMRTQGLGMWPCQHVLLMQRSDVTVASQRLFSFRMKWIFISDHDWKRGW